jgi:integrase
MGKSEYDPVEADRRAWNSRRKVGAKRALKPRQVWAIRFFLDQYRRTRDRALFDLAIDSKLRGCDVVKVKIGDIVLGGQIRARAIVVQAKTGKPVQFELMFDARTSLLAWLERRGGTLADYVFPSRIDYADHLSTRQYARLRMVSISLLRATKAARASLLDWALRIGWLRCGEPIHAQIGGRAKWISRSFHCFVPCRDTPQTRRQRCRWWTTISACAVRSSGRPMQIGNRRPGLDVVIARTRPELDDPSRYRYSR